MNKRTKIVATIGPASGSVEILRNMIKAGMNVARLNFSHGTHENHAELITNIRAAAKEENAVVAIMQDLQGPKIRVAEMPEDGVELKEGETVVFDTSLDTYTNGAVPVGYDDLHNHVKVGERLLLNDGRVETIVESVEGTKINVKVQNTGVITSHKGINIPDSGLTISALTKKDKEDAAFGVKQGVDIIAFSFVTAAKDVVELRELVDSLDTEDTPIHIITKIERAIALKNIDEIIKVADGIMVARGDLGIETPAATVPTSQKMLIEKALKAAKPVIVATQMLDSMTDSPRPTRAEVSDVANAVMDHTDAVMLSNESATGKYPVEAVQMLTDIILETEKSDYDVLELPRHESADTAVNDAVSKMSRLLAEQVGAKCILGSSHTGKTARLLSHYRPEFPVYIASNNERVQAQLQLSWGIQPFLLPICSSVEELRDSSLEYIKDHTYVNAGDTVIVVTGGKIGSPGAVNKLEVTTIE